MMKTSSIGRQYGLGGRMVAVLLLLLLCLDLLPVAARAADEGSAPLNWKTLESTGKASAGTAVENTYILEISSGTRRGGGVTDNVLFISVDYTTADNLSRSIILIPGENEMGRGFDQAAAAGNRESRRNDVQSIFGITTRELRDKDSLGSVQTDQIMFTAPERISTIDKIQVFGKRTERASDWACQGMRVYRVDTLYGLEMYGWYSDSGYIDFAGELIAQVVMSDPSGIVFKWDNTAGVHEITTTSHGATLDNSVRAAHDSQTGNRVVFRLDFADVAGAGLEALAGAYELGGNTKARELQLCECGALTVRYRDIYGCIREVALPLVANALGQTIEALNDPAFAEYAQQGDSIAIPAMLPDFQEINSVAVTLGYSKAAEEAKLSSGSAQTFQKNRARRSEEDSISYICFAVYRDVEAQVALEGASLRSRFIPGGGNPVLYSTATSATGITLTMNSKSTVNMQNYREGMTLSPVDRTDRYLITVSTDNVINAGTNSDLILQFHYIGMKDKTLESEEYHIRDYIRDYYGEWPGNVDDFAYRYGLRDGGTVQFIVPLQGVNEFTDVKIDIEGNDEWQFTGLEIAMVTSFSARYAAWDEISAGGLQSHLRYSRRVETEGVCFSVGTVYEEEEERPDPQDEDSDWEHGYLIQDDDTDHTFDGESKEVVTKKDVDWSKLRHYMTYADAQQDLGFTKERFVYEVMVQVAGKTVNPGNDDCGSKNLFYFGLIFEHGTSGFTLANQQVQGDAFRTGAEVRFKIPVSQDYGEVTAIQVIPDSQDGNSDIYDKLQIEEISVTRLSKDSVSPTWKAKGSGVDGLGWVGIDYRDPGEMGTNTGAKGRTLSELSTTYQITETSYSTNLLVSITTGPYDGWEQFSGGLAMSVDYYNTEGRMAPRIEGIDVVAAMNAYSGRVGSHQRTYTVGTNVVTETVDYEVSNPTYQFRPGATDSFLVTIDDVYQLADLSFAVRSNLLTDWTITDINVYQVNGTPQRYINAYGAYDYSYPEGQGLKRVATWTMDTLTYRLPTFDSTQNDSIVVIPIPLECEAIELSKDARSWASKVLPEPPSHNDTLNLILYPTTAGGAADPSTYEPTAAVQFTNVTTRQQMQVSTGKMRSGTDSYGNSVFYAVGVSANDMDSLERVTWSADAMRRAQPSIDHGIIQRLRGGVLIETYVLAGIGGTLYTKADSAFSANKQRVQLQLSKDIKAQNLVAREKDLAVAVYFRPEAPLNGQEYRSKYIYLTDQGYSSVKPGQLLDLEFSLGDIEEITGVNLVSMGSLNVTADGALLTDMTADGAIRHSWSIQNLLEPTQRPVRYDVGGSMQMLTLLLTTAADEVTAGSGTEGRVRLTVGYYDIYGVQREYTLDDARPYIESGEGFVSGGTDLLRMLIPEFSELRWVELEPLPKSGGASSEGENVVSLASWKLGSISAAVGVSGRSIDKTVDQRIMESKPLRIGFSDIVLMGTVYVAQAGGNLSDPIANISTRGSDSITVDSGADIFITVLLSGSDQSFTATLDALDPVTDAVERAYLDPTHGYSDETLNLIYEQASQSLENAIFEQEKVNAQRVMDLVDAMRNTGGRFYSDQVRLTTPHNYTDGKLKYRITVRSEETTDAFFTLDITVRSEPNELAAAVEEWDGMRTMGTVYVRKRPDAAEEKVGLLEGQTLSQLLESGGGVTIIPHIGVDETSFGASILELDPATNATATAELDATHGYTEEQLLALMEEARDTLTLSAATDAERLAAREVLSAINAVAETEGSFELAEGEVRFTAPRNYTGSVLYYRILVTAAQTGDTIFAVDASVKPEENPLTAAVAAWRAVQTVGTVSVLDGRGRPTDEVRLAKGETYAQKLDSGESLGITPYAGGDGGFTAVIKSVDPANGALGTANLEASTGYTTDALYELRNEARSTMSDDNATDAEVRAAEAVVRAIDTIRNTDGDFDFDREEILFTAPHNYTDSTLYYRIIVTASQTGETLFTVDISVMPEANPLDEAVANWRAVQTAGTVRILDADGDTVQTYSLAPGETYAQRLESGGGLTLLPRSSGSFRAEISGLDPTIGATSAADLSGAYGYSESELIWMSDLAKDALASETSSEVISAAKALLAAISEVRDSEGAFSTTDSQIRFIAPRNFSGSTIYYRITVTSRDTGETMITMDISVLSERDDIQSAFNDLDRALARAQDEREAEEAAADDTGADEGGDEAGADEGEG